MDGYRIYAHLTGAVNGKRVFAGRGARNGHKSNNRVLFGGGSGQQPKDQGVAPTERTIGESFKDVGAGLVSGVGSLVQLPGQLYGLATGDFSKTGALGLGKTSLNTAKK